MAVVNNTLSAIGDVLFVQTQANIAGNILSLTSYTDDLVGETADRFFTKQFRVSMNGVVFTSWMDLTTPNLNSVSGLTGGIVYFNFAYTRAGTDPTGLLEFIDVIVDGTIDAFVCSGVTTHLSIFDGYSCGNVYTAELCNNLLKKLYERGIVPEYIERGDGVTDTDYVAFWRSVACYFSMFVSFAKDFDNIINKTDWLIEYLREKGMFLCADDSLLEDLQYLAGHFYDEIRKRGTIEVIRPKGFIRVDLSTVPVDGELLRLVCWSTCEEFLFALSKPERRGWCMRQSSPMYRHTLFEEQFIKGYENTKFVVDLSKYPLINSGNVFVSPRPDPEGNSSGMMILDSSGLTSADVMGIGGSSNRNGITVSPYLDYEITFWLKVNRVHADYIPKFTFGVNAFDCNLGSYNMQAITSPGTSIQNNFASNFSLAKQHVWYFVRGIVYAYNTDSMNSPNDQINLNIGQNLKFISESVTKIVPKIVLVGQDVGSSQAWIWDFKVRPLRTNYSNGFLNAANLLHIIAKNKNAKYSNEISENIIRKFIVPYGSIPLNTWLGQMPAPDGSSDRGYWTINNKFKIATSI